MRRSRAALAGWRWQQAGVLVAALLTMLLTMACRSEADRQAALANGDDPIAALSATVESTRYTTAYWMQQADSSPSLWAKAVAYCDTEDVRATGQRVNCGAVAAAQFERSARSPATPPRRDPQPF